MASTGTGHTSFRARILINTYIADKQNITFPVIYRLMWPTFATGLTHYAVQPSIRAS